MRNFGNKWKWRNVLESWPVLSLLFVIVVVFAWNVFGFWGKMKETSKNKEIAVEKVAGLEAERDQRSSDIESLQTESGIEANIRDKFGWAKEGEGLIIVMEDQNQKTVEPEGSGGGFWSFFRNLFK